MIIGKGFGAAFLAAVMLFSVGCSSSKDATNEPTSPDGGAKPAAGTKSEAAGKPHKVAFVTNNASDYWTIAKKGVEKAEKEFPEIAVDFRMPQDGTAANQRQIIDDLSAKGVEAIAISPVDPKNQTELLNKVAAKSLLITQDSDAPLSNRACYIGTDNVAAGKKVGDEIKKALPQGGDVIAFVGMADAQNAKERLDGLKASLQGSNVHLKDIRQDNTDHAKAKTNAADVLVKEPNIAGLVGIWSYNGPAIYSAVKDANKKDKVKIVCFDEEDQTLAGIKAGYISATIVQQPFEFGYQAIKNMRAYLNGDKSVFPANKLNVVDTKVITSANVDEFKANLDKLRGR